jgi:hypothetical protein
MTIMVSACRTPHDAVKVEAAVSVDVPSQASTPDIMRLAA